MKNVAQSSSSTTTKLCYLPKKGKVGSKGVILLQKYPLQWKKFNPRKDLIHIATYSGYILRYI